jgi:hypothetical protein
VTVIAAETEHDGIGDNALGAGPHLGARPCR